MKRALLAIAIGMFVIAGAAQPAMAQQDNSDQAPEEPENDSDAEEENETQEEEPEEVENDENESTQEENRSDQARGESAQFDARLGTAISTLDSLVEIAPNEEARNGLQNALDNLREVQNNTDTASSAAPGERPEGPERPDEAENDSEAEEENGTQGPPEDRGPSQNSNRPGFVNEMLGGLFG